jgi:truncated hemoglobin YjbI
MKSTAALFAHRMGGKHTPKWKTSIAHHFLLSIEPMHFDRWLALFEQTVSEVCPPAAGTVFMEKARRLADSFEIALAGRRGEIAEPRHSTSPPSPPGMT